MGRKQTFLGPKGFKVRYSFAFVENPDDFGTLDEYFEAITLIQTKNTAIFHSLFFLWTLIKN